MFAAYARGTESASPSTPTLNREINDDSPPTSPARGRGAISTLRTEPMHMVSQDRSPSTNMPLMPTMDLQVTYIDAPPRFFLATPAEIWHDRGTRSRNCLSQSQSNEQETPATGHIDRTRGRHQQWASPVSCSGQAYWDDTDDMIDEEVAVASDRAYRCQRGSIATRFKLRPKPLREEEARDPDLLFRS